MAYRSIYEEIKDQFKFGTHTVRLCLLLLGIYLAILVIQILGKIPNIGFDITDFTYWVGMPAGFQAWIYKPWTIFTYALVHLSIWHILNNLLGLYIFGRILEEFVGSKYIRPVFILGALAGGLAFLISSTVFENYFANSSMIGASAGVLALLFAAVRVTPDYTIGILFIGQVRIKYIALFILILDLAFIANDANTGGHIAHIAGAMMGYFVMSQVYNGVDVTTLISGVKSKLFPTKTASEKAKHLKVVYKKNTGSTDERTRSKISSDRKSDIENIDKILDKINEKGGIDQLTKEEREILFRAPKDLE